MSLESVVRPCQRHYSSVLDAAMFPAAPPFVVPPPTTPFAQPPAAGAAAAHMMGAPPLASTHALSATAPAYVPIGSVPSARRAPPVPLPPCLSGCLRTRCWLHVWDCFIATPYNTCTHACCRRDRPTPNFDDGCTYHAAPIRSTQAERPRQEWRPQSCWRGGCSPEGTESFLLLLC